MKSAIWLLMCAMACGSPAPPPGRVTTFEVEAPTTFVRRVRADGLLQAVESTPVTTPQDAQEPLKVAWVIADGRQVEPGDVLFRFDPTEMERRLAESRDDMTTAQRQMGKVGVEGRSAGDKRDRTAELASHEAEVAKDLEARDPRYFSRVEVAEAEVDLELALAKVAHATEVKAVERRVTAKQLQLHRISRDQHGREVSQAQEGLSRLQVTAPHAGVVVLTRHRNGEITRVGDTVWPGQTLAQLPIVASMEAQVFVLEADAGDLAQGLAAEVVVEAHPTRTWSAKVGRVDALAQPRHPEVPINYFGVTLALEQTDNELMRVGQRVRATILVEMADAIVVPRQAVFERDGRRLVYRRRGDGFEAIDVTLGGSSAGRVVIASGLGPGDRVALQDPTAAAGQTPAAAGISGATP